MAVQKGLRPNSITSDIIRDGEVTSVDIKDGTIHGIDILDGTIQSIDIQDGTIQGIDIANAQIEARHMKWNTYINAINGAYLQDRTVKNSKMDWTDMTHAQAINAFKIPEGIFVQTYDLEDCTANTGLTNNVTTAHINPIHLNYPLVANYFTYILTSGKNGQKVKVAVYNFEGNKIWESTDQTGINGTFKIPMDGQLLLPGVYYILFLTNNGDPKFLVPPANSYTVIPQRGTYTITTWEFPSALTFSDINQSTARQPWCAISKY